MEEFQDRRANDRSFKESILRDVAILLTTQRQHHELIEKLEKDVQQQIEDVYERLSKVDNYLRGELGGKSIEDRLKSVERVTNENSILLMGGSGPLRDGGLMQKVSNMERGEAGSLERRRQTLMFWGALLAAIFSFASAFGPKLIQEWKEADPHKLTAQKEPKKTPSVRYRKIS